MRAVQTADGCPGGLRSISPSGPWALNFITQSRTIWSVTPPIFAASVRARAFVNRRQRQKPPAPAAHPSTVFAAALTIRASKSARSGIGPWRTSCSPPRPNKFQPIRESPP